MTVEALADLGRNVGQVKGLVHCLLRDLGVGSGNPVVSREKKAEPSSEWRVPSTECGDSHMTAIIPRAEV
jgi:hypothetical protein